VGGGDAALENALILGETASSVTLVHRRAEFRARAEFLEKVKNNPKIEILTETVVREISGGERLETVAVENQSSRETRSIPAAALLVRVGVEPSTELFRGLLALDKNGYVEIDRNCETGIRGVFAVGDVANPLSPTVSSAVGMGATAAKVIFSWLNR
jgi:thioredoxin reductase (NADPH)